jgi:hypothetical protein
MNERIFGCLPPSKLNISSEFQLFTVKRFPNSKDKIREGGESRPGGHLNDSWFGYSFCDILYFTEMLFIQTGLKIKITFRTAERNGETSHSTVQHSSER